MTLETGHARLAAYLEYEGDTIIAYPESDTNIVLELYKDRPSGSVAMQMYMSIDLEQWRSFNRAVEKIMQRGECTE